MQLRVAVQGQIELLENGKKTVSDRNMEEEQSLDELPAPIDDTHLEVDKSPNPRNLYRLHSVGGNTDSQATA